MKKVYISGKITGLPIEEALTLFQIAEDFVSSGSSHIAINPMKLVPFVDDKAYEQYLIEDIKHLLHCNCIYMLNNWEQSKGARIERAIALELGIEIIYQES